jgi:hypothetical protein
MREPVLKSELLDDSRSFPEPKNQKSDARIAGKVIKAIFPKQVDIELEKVETSLSTKVIKSIFPKEGHLNLETS